MIENKGNYKIQTPDTAGNYLWNGEEVFATEITLPNNAPMWQEVTPQFKEEWEEQHQQEEEFIESEEITGEQ